MRGHQVDGIQICEGSSNWSVSVQALIVPSLLIMIIFLAHLIDLPSLTPQITTHSVKDRHLRRALHCDAQTDKTHGQHRLRLQQVQRETLARRGQAATAASAARLGALLRTTRRAPTTPPVDADKG